MTSNRCNCYDCVPSRKARNEFRHTKAGPEELPQRGKKKNTNQWCKGKVGREHVPHVVSLSYCNVTECKNCGKRLRYHWGW